MRVYLLALLAVVITGCTSGGDRPDEPLKVGVQNIYSINSNGKLQRDRSMERVQSQQQHGNSDVDGGATFGR